MPIINMVYKKKKWWKPWANTIAYRPLESNANDIVWWYNWTNISWISYETLSSWKKVAKTTAESANINIPWSSLLPILSSNDFTISFWIYTKWVVSESSSTNYALLFWIWKDSYPYTWPQVFLNKWHQWWGNWWIRFLPEFMAHWATSTSNYNSILEKWTHIFYIRENWVFKWYINNSLETTETLSLTYWTWDKWFLFCRWDVWQQQKIWSMWSEFILEKKARTEEERTKYYNQTKWNYWL